MGWTQLESMMKIMLVGIEDASFGYDLTIENVISEGPPPDTGGSLEKLNLPPWRRVLRTTLFLLGKLEDQAHKPYTLEEQKAPET